MPAEPVKAYWFLKKNKNNISEPQIGGGKVYRFFKRLFDIVFSGLLILVLSPVLLLLALAIMLTSKGSPLFLQKRVGKDKKLFTILKFRTMYSNTAKDVPTHLLDDPNRFLTPIGKVLRKLSLDELPQLFNIFVGQMSFIGPRPALWNQDDLVKLRDRWGANNVRPGLSGWAQVNGRDSISLECKVRSRHTAHKTDYLLTTYLYKMDVPFLYTRHSENQCSFCLSFLFFGI